MKKIKYFIIAAAAVAVIVCGYFFLISTGEKWFDFSAIDDSCKVYVVRNDHNVYEYVDDEHMTQKKKYLLEDEARQQLFSLLTETRYRRKIELNVFSFVPGISMRSASSSDHVNYRIIVQTADGSEIMHLLTLGCDYINPPQSGINLRITDGAWGQKLDTILENAHLIDTYFDNIP